MLAAGALNQQAGWHLTWIGQLGQKLAVATDFVFRRTYNR
jgi:hypothetical protein